jgi:cytochrome c oxidase subunit 3
MNNLENQHDEAPAAHVHRDDFASKIGMWLFLFTEVLLFGGLFLLYMAYRVEYTEIFKHAAKELDITIGTINTLILLTSSLTMALSIAALQKGKKNLSLMLQFTTIIFALGFMVNKYFEWSAKFHHGIYPGSEKLAEKENGEIIFFGLYYAMTGLHGLHVLVGMVFIGFMMNFVSRDKITHNNFAKLENAGLYWHLVDLIWIFLFPLFYLLH